MSRVPEFKAPSTTQVMVDGQTVDGALAPHDRTFRNAWQLDGDAITVDMAKAREIHRDRLRQARKPILESLDAEWFRATEVDDVDGKGLIAERKQALRDATHDPRIDAAATPEQLSALTLEVLTA